MMTTPDRVRSLGISRRWEWWLGCLLSFSGALPLAAQGPDLPWTRNPGQTATRRASSVKELLVNVEPSHWGSFQDGEPLSVNEDETLYRLLFRLPRVGGYDWQRLSQPLGDGRSLVEKPAEQRGLSLAFQGRARTVEVVPILPEIARRFEFDHYYRVTVEPAGGAPPLIVCARSIPRAWEKQTTLDEPCSGYGVFLKVAAPVDAAAPLVVAAPRLAWHPDHPAPDRGVEADHVLLAELGLDVDRLRDLDGRDSLPLGTPDTECFYQMLAAVKRSEPAQTGPRAAPFDLAALLQNPGRQHGRLFRVSGRAKRITRIVLTDPEVKDRFGVDHYYQVDVMVPLGDQEVRVPRDKNDKTGPVFSVAFPVICCVLEVPERLQATSDREDLNEDMTFDAFNVRLWSYQSAFLDQFEREQRTQQTADGIAPPAGQDPSADAPTRRRQPSPLFIARTADFAPALETTDFGLGKVMTWILIGAIGLVVLLLWRHQVGERRAREQLRARTAATTSGTTLVFSPSKEVVLEDGPTTATAERFPDQVGKPEKPVE